MAKDDVTAEREKIETEIAEIKNNLYLAEKRLKELQNQCTHPDVKWESSARRGYARFFCPFCYKTEKSD